MTREEETARSEQHQKEAYFTNFMNFLTLRTKI